MGVGTIFNYWKLILTLREPLISRTNFALFNTTLCNVTFILPPLTEFKGLKAKALKIEVSTTVEKVIEKICETFSVSQPERFALATEQFVLHDKSGWTKKKKHRNKSSL